MGDSGSKMPQPVNLCEYSSPSRRGPNDRRHRAGTEVALVILALDTTSAGGSLALARDGRLLDEAVGDPGQTHGQRLPGALQDLLNRHNLTTATVDRYAVASGPGSFTGLRVGIATIQGLALAHDKRVVAISVLDTLVEVAARLAGHAPPAPDLIAPWIDAKRGEVFSALYAPVPLPEAGDTPRTAGERWRVAVKPVAVHSTKPDSVSIPTSSSRPSL